MISTSFLSAVGFAASAGVATFFAPCAFPLLPGYVGYFVQHSQSRLPSPVSAIAAATGSLVALGGVAGLALLLGQRLTSVLPLFEPIAGLALVCFGVLFLFERTPTMVVELPTRPESVLGFGIFGAGYALAAAGCVVPLFLGVVTQALLFSFSQAVTILVVYAIAVSAPLVGVTLLTSAGIETWRELGQYATTTKKLAAVVMIVAGLGQLYLSIVVLDVL